MIYKNNRQSISELKDENKHVISEIEPQLCQNVIAIFSKRVDICRVARVDRLADINFRTIMSELILQLALKGFRELVQVICFISSQKKSYSEI